MSKPKKICRVSRECVACGTCAGACKCGAITIYKGLIAVIDKDKCVGCEKCVNVCPAGVMTVVLREGEPNEQAKAVV